MKILNFNKIIKNINNNIKFSSKEKILNNWIETVKHQQPVQWSEAELMSIKLRIKREIRRKRKIYRFLYAGAAMFIGLILFSILYRNTPFNKPIVGEEIHAQILPAQFSGILKQPGQKDIDLTKLKIDSSYVFADISLQRIDSQLIKVLPTHLHRSILNRIVSPRGSKISILFADGSMVKMNVASELIFPSNFNEQEREVTLIGEAFFDIKKDSKNRGFSVQVGNNRIEVLGTKFNLSNQKDSSLKATLYEGLIKVKTEKQEFKLAPGEELVIHTNGQYKKSFFLKDRMVNWHDGQFNLDGKNIVQIMDEIAAWYNVEVIYKHVNLQQHYMGQVSRALDLHSLLETLSLVNANTFEIKGRRIIVR
ncbi:FecR family protein [Sphingobacterium sp. HJSM2_6]|uniref:FecR family protein n=1 Tax=Sphingobacterium sp. HJSM2_6 TaxID=3366264 RepID=UPI003BC14DA7